MATPQAIGLLVRVVNEAGIIAALAFWGVSTGTTPVLRWVLGIAAPAIGFGLWAMVEVGHAHRFAEPLRWMQESAISAVAALALYVRSAPVAAAVLIVVTVVHHGLLYGTGGTLRDAKRLLGP